MRPSQTLYHVQNSILTCVCLLRVVCSFRWSKMESLIFETHSTLVLLETFLRLHPVGMKYQPSRSSDAYKFPNTLALCQISDGAVFTMNISHIPAFGANPHRSSQNIPSLPLVVYLPTILSLVVSAVASFCYSRTKTLELPETYQWRIVQCCAWSTEAMQWVVLLSCLVNMHLATTLEPSIYDDPTKTLIRTGLVGLHWLAIDIMNWIDGWLNIDNWFDVWMNSEDSKVDGLQLFMLTRATATKAWSIAVPPKHVRPTQTKPSLPTSSPQANIHLQLPCIVDLKSSVQPIAKPERRSSWCTTSSEHSMEPNFSTTPALYASSPRRHSEPTSNLTPLKQSFNLDYSLPPFAPEEVNAQTADRLLGLAAATSDSDDSDLSSVAAAKMSWVKTCVEQFEALQG